MMQSAARSAMLGRSWLQTTAAISFDRGVYRTGTASKHARSLLSNEVSISSEETAAVGFIANSMSFMSEYTGPKLLTASGNRFILPVLRNSLDRVLVRVTSAGVSKLCRQFGQFGPSHAYGGMHAEK